MTLIGILVIVVAFGAIAWGISRNMGFFGKIFIWLLAIAAMVLAIGFLLGGTFAALLS